MSPSILSLEIQKQKDWLAQKKTEMNEITAGDEAALLLSKEGE